MYKNKKQAALNDFFSPKYEVKKMYDLFDWVITKEIKDDAFDYLEFGVFKGDSIKWWVQHNQHKNTLFFGFDTFEGLPEDFGMIKKGGYSANNTLPDITDSRCKFIKGLFQETLFPFLKNYDGSKRKVIHIDCDLYSSTMFVLSTLAPYLKKDDIIIFDEFVTPTQEFKAFHDFYSSFYFEFELIGSVNNYHQTVVKIKNIPPTR